MRRQDCTPQEQWVLEQLEQGGIADLNQKFGEAEEKRRLRAPFLEALLTDDIENFKPRRQGIRIAWAVIPEDLDLANAEVAHIVVLRGLVFKRKVVCRDARFKRHLILNGCRFLQAADFDGVQVAGNVFCRKAVFQGPVDFGDADIGGKFRAVRAQFNRETKNANFNGLKVGQDAFFDKAVFQGPVDFGGADIGGQFRAVRAQFNRETAKANFNRLKVGKDAFFREAVFRGQVDFGGADIGGKFSAEGAQFNRETAKANFNRLKVGQAAFFLEAIFQGPVDFVGADIGGQFIADGARFLKGAMLGGIKVGLSAFFRGAEFHGSVSLNHAYLQDLLIGGTPIPELHLSHTRIDREIKIHESEIGSLQAGNLGVQGPASLKQVTIKEEADLRYANLQTLHLVDVKWPDREEKVRLEGLRYKGITAGPTGDDHDALLAWLDGARFHTQPYRQLEACWQEHGERDWADKAFLRLKQRQAREDLGKGRFLSFLWTWFLLGLAGYGRKPLRPLFWAGLMFLLGIFAFHNPATMVPRHLSVQAVYTNPAITGLYAERDKVFEEKGKEHYCPYWYTLDLMLPVDLEMAKYYEPKGLWARVYFHLLPLGGWVIIAALAASLTGLFELQGYLREQ